MIRELEPLLVGDCIQMLRLLKDQSVNCCVTSPPYFGLRDYGHDGQIGLEETPGQFVAKLAEVFAEVYRVLRDDGTLWLNLGDSWSTGSKWGGSTGGKAAKALHGLTGGGRTKQSHGIPDKQLLGIPWRVAFALQDAGWYLRQDIIWAKPNPMPESVTDRCTKAHEYLFLLSKSPRYYFDSTAIKEPAIGGQTGSAASFKREGSKRAQVIHGQSAGTHRADREDVAYNGETRNRRSVWSIPTRAFKGAHFATFPEQLIEPCVLAGAPEGGTVLDPFMGSGTSAVVAERLGRKWVGCELNRIYADMALDRIAAARTNV